MRLSKSSIVIFSIACLIGIVAAVWSFFPYLAERNYRDGFNFAQGQQFLPAIEKMTKATHYAPLEAQYKVELGRVMEDYAKTLPPDKAIAQLEKARTLYTELLGLDNRNPWYENRMAAVYSGLASLDVANQKEDLKKAEYFTRRGSNFDKNNPLFQLNLAYFLQNTGRLEEAKIYYLRAIQIDGRISEARFNLAAVYMNEKRPDKALEQYLAIYNNEPQMAGLLPSIGRVYLNQRQPQLALPYLEKNAQLYPFDRIGLILLAETYNQLKMTAKTIETLDAEVKRFPDDSQSRMNLIRLYRINGQNTEASQQEALLGAFLKATPK